MTASDNTISIINQALLRIGARATISSLNEGSTEAAAASILFLPTFQSLARTANWNCLRRQVTLSLLKAAAGTPENPQGTTLPLPPPPYLYSYAEPADCLQVRYLMPSFLNNVNGGGVPLTTASITASPFAADFDDIPFAVAYDIDANNNPLQVILTDQTQAQCVYTVNQANPVIWDSLFVSAMVASLAAFLVPALSLNLGLAQMAVKMADGIIGQARVRDGDEGFTSQNRNASWMSARTSGVTYGPNNVSNTSYASMNWPV